MLPPKNRPRYLPTLTQVVTTAELTLAESSFSVSSQENSNAVDREQLVQQIVRSLMPLVTARIQESLREIVDDRLHRLEANMQSEVESMVRHAMNECKAPFKE